MDLGLYVHLPFCRSKCPYCDFNSYPLPEKQIIKNYIHALYEEIDIYSKKLKNVLLKSIYFGGGTPTVFSGFAINNLLNYCKSNFKIDNVIEITIEANPGTVNGEKLKNLQSGINRISLGGQSFNDRILKRIGRIHSSEDIINSYFQAREAGFCNINLDIIYALPDQSLKDLQTTLCKAIDLGPEHISIYGLTLSPGTKFYLDAQKNLLNLPSEDIEFEMFQWAINYLKKNDYEHYEISNFALPGKRSVHNQIYWNNLPYLGIGAGAFSYINGYRYGNIKKPAEYIQRLAKGKLPIEQGERLSLKKKMSETIILWLRTRDGVNYEKFQQRFKTNLHQLFGLQIEELKKSKLIEEDTYSFRLSEKGIFLANKVFGEFLI
ncbi:MAG: radical SAM family heme chaperone HemW [Candidatus Caldatribacteriota bacterium]|nr:radical SAM family heme chaperone HemW [Candidatus Caldatribacteriota bacterium]